MLVIDNLSSGKLARLPLSHSHLKVIEGDMLDTALLFETLLSCDAVIHLAAISSVTASIANPEASFRVNVQGFLSLLHAIRETKRDIRLLYASSAAVYGDTSHLPCEEKMLLPKPLSPYALHKINNEQYAHLYATLYGLNAIGLRYFNVYGPHQDPSSPYAGVISQFISKYDSHETATLFGDGSQSRDFIYVDDVVRANLLALNSTSTGIVNIATGQPETLLALIGYIQSVGKTSFSYQCAPKRAGDIYASFADVRLARELLGFHATISLTEGVHFLTSSDKILSK